MIFIVIYKQEITQDNVKMMQLMQFKDDFS